MDVRDELEDDYTEVEGVPFIADEAFIDQYGISFEIRFKNKRLEVLRA